MLQLNFTAWPGLPNSSESVVLSPQRLHVAEYTLALKGLLYHNFGVYVCTIAIPGPFG